MLSWGLEALCSGNTFKTQREVESDPEFKGQRWMLPWDGHFYSSLCKLKFLCRSSENYHTQTSLWRAENLNKYPPKSQHGLQRLFIYEIVMWYWWQLLESKDLCNMVGRRPEHGQQPGPCGDHGKTPRIKALVVFPSICVFFLPLLLLNSHDIFKTSGSNLGTNKIIRCLQTSPPWAFNWCKGWHLRKIRDPAHIETSQNNSYQSVPQTVDIPLSRQLWDTSKCFLLTVHVKKAWSTGRH